jgi:hypothetical protein
MGWRIRRISVNPFNRTGVVLMTVETAKFVRKPLYVEAVQVTAENFEEVIKWCQGDVGFQDGSDTKPLRDVETIDPSKQFIRIRVHNPQSQRQTKAFVGDWILYTERGYKIYTEKAFKENFDLANAESAAA